MPAANVEALTEAVTVAGVVPLLDTTDSQLPPEVVEAAVVKLRAAPLLETVKFCGAGLAPPIWKSYVSEAADAESVGAAVTVKVTGMLNGPEACVEVTLIR